MINLRAMLVRRTILLSFSVLLGFLGAGCDREQTPAKETKGS